MLLPWRSRARALFRTSKAVSVPRRDMRRASCNSCCVVCAMMTNTPDDPNGTLYAVEVDIFVITGTWTAPTLYNECHAEGRMTTYLHELYAHQEWADAEHWRAFEAYPAALEDKAIRERLHHIHLVQHGFLCVASPQRAEFALKKMEDFLSMADLKAYARQGLDELGELLKETDQERMEEIIEVPWLKPPARISGG